MAAKAKGVGIQHDGPEDTPRCYPLTYPTPMPYILPPHEKNAGLESFFFLSESLFFRSLSGAVFDIRELFFFRVSCFNR